MGIDHYENFPVASLLVPRPLRRPIEEIYRFARCADDIADEGEDAPATRLAALAALHADLDGIDAGAYPAGARWSGLATAVHDFALPVQLLRDLLRAFEQDVRGMVYRDYADLHAYCRYSANPVGRLLLILYRREEPELLRWSDAICSGLQLVNFWQDVDRDHAKGRVYVPQSEFQRFGVDVAQIARRVADAAWGRLLRAQTQIARELLLSGRPLAAALGGRIGWELRLVIQGGLRITERIDAVDGDVFARRPVLNAGDWARMALRAAAMT
jgi:squalene synthase HpnC